MKRVYVRARPMYITAWFVCVNRLYAIDSASRLIIGWLLTHARESILSSRCLMTRCVWDFRLLTFYEFMQAENVYVVGCYCYNWSVCVCRFFLYFATLLLYMITSSHHCWSSRLAYASEEKKVSDTGFVGLELHTWQIGLFTLMYVIVSKLVFF